MTDFKDFGSFAKHLTQCAARLSPALEAATEASAQIIEDTAKAEFGLYQPKIGPFAAWAELADSTKEERISLGYTENDPLYRSGHLQSTITHESGMISSSTYEAVVGSDDQIMVDMKLGTANVPPRAVLGPAGMRTEKEINQLIADTTLAVLLGK